MSRKLIVEVVGDTKSLDRSLNRASKNVKGFGKNVGQAGRGATAASGSFRSLGRSVAFASGAFLGAAGFTAVVKDSINAASDLHEEMNKSEVVFGKASKSVEEFAKTSAKSFGIAEDQAIGMAATFGNLLHPMGIARGQAAKMSVQFVKLAADLASFNNATPEDTLAAIQSGLAGQVRPLRQYGIFLSKARIEAEALRLGLLKGNVSQQAARIATDQLSVAQVKYNDALKKYGPTATQTVTAHITLEKAQARVAKVAEGVGTALTNQQKALATTSIIMRDSADAQGDFARTADGLANKERILKAEIRDTETIIGTALMPTVLKITGAMADWLGKTENQRKVQETVNSVVKTAGTILGTLHTAVQNLTPVLKTFTTALGGTKRTFELLFALGIAAKLRAIGIQMGFVASQATVAAGVGTGAAAGGVAGLLFNLGKLAKIGTIVIGIDILMGGHPLGKGPAGGRYSGSKGWGNLWRDLTPGFISGSDPVSTAGPSATKGAGPHGKKYKSAQGASGPVTPGLKALETAVGGRINDDFATSGHAPNSYHYKGQAADLAVDRGVWNKLFANRRMFAELFGPWGLYHYGTQFYDKKLQADHMNHIHVAYTGGPQAISKMLSGGSGGGGGGGSSAAPAVSTAGTGGATHVGGTSKTAPAWKGATQATIIAAKASVTSMIGAAKQVIGGMAGPMDDIERSAIAHLQKLKEHLHPHMTATDLAKTRADIKKWGKVLTDEVAAQTKAAKRAFDKASKDLFRAFDKETAAGLKALAAPDETPAERLLRERGEARDDATRQQALADAQASGDAQAVADALYDIETARLEKIAAAERKAADEQAATAQDAYQQARDDQKQALQDQLDDWETWLGNKKKTWNEFWAWIKANPNGGNIAPPNMGSTRNAPTFGSPKPGNAGGWVQQGHANGWVQVGGSNGGGSNRQFVPTLATGGMVSKTGLAVVHEGETFSGVNGGGELVIHNIIQLDGKAVYESWKKQAARDVKRNGGTGIRA